MNKIRAFLKLVRWTNLVMVVMMMCLVYYCLMRPMSLSGIVGAMPPFPAFLLLLVSLVFIVAGGYVINDVFDVVIDRANKPDGVIVSRVFSEREARLFYVILTFIGLAAGLASSVMVAKTKFLTLFLLLLLLTFVLYSYSAVYKRKIVIGNLMVSLSVAFAVFLPWLFEMIYLSNNLLLLSVNRGVIMGVLPFVLIYTLFAFIMNLIREIVKDAEDKEGDAVVHCRTIPVVYGLDKTKLILYVLLTMLLLLLLAYEYVLVELQLYVSFVLMAIVVLASVLLMVKIHKAKDSCDFSRVSKMTKMIMLVGVVSMVFVV